MPHLLRTVHRSSYYVAKPLPMLVRRDGGDSAKNDLIVLSLVVMAIVLAVVVGLLLIRKAMSSAHKSMFKARGEGAHFEGASLRRHRPERVRVGNSKTHTDWRMQSDVPRPQSTYSLSTFSQAGHTSTSTSTFLNDEFEPTVWTSRTTSPISVESLLAASSHPHGNWV